VAAPSRDWRCPPVSEADAALNLPPV
jgi:hypothetical protein